MVEWRHQFDDLRQRRPEAAARVCRRLLMDLQKKRLVDLDALDERPEGAKRDDQGILGRDPKRHASRDLGERLITTIVERASEQIRALLNERSG
mgnify:CR=1 FL=1